MDVTLDLPDDLIRKIRALNILTGGASASFETALIDIIQESVSAQIVRSVSREDAALQPVLQPVYTRPLSARQAARATVTEVYSDDDRDMTGVSAGLGDEDFDIDLGPEEDEEEDEQEAAKVAPPSKKSFAPPPQPAAKKQRRPRKPKAAPITDAELEHDLDVTDPEHEAAAEAPTFADQMGQEVEGEELFAQAAAFPVDSRKARRKRQFGSTRAKVTPMLEESMDTF